MNAADTTDDRVATLHADHETWAPYCLKCSTLGRMTITAYGFKCEGVGDWAGRPGCGNEVNGDGTPRAKSNTGEAK